MNRLASYRIAWGVLALALVSSAAAQPLGTAFTYQGRLSENGNAPTGPYDFQFRLYDAVTGGNQVGATAVVDDLQVSGGLFMASLDFGPQFSGQKRWLQLEVRPGAGGGTYTILAPRQEVTATPNALFSTRPWETTSAGIVYTGPGKVGVGTTAPGMSLEVSTPSFYGFPALGASDGNSAWSYLHVSSLFEHSLIWDNARAMRFGTETFRGGPGYVEHMRITPDGKVGVRQWNPGARFQAEGVTGEWAIFGRSPNSLGVFGQVSDTGSGNLGTGVLGRSESTNQASNAIFGYASNIATGVYGVSEVGNGIRGATNGPTSSGVVGSASQASSFGGLFYNTGGGVALKADGLCQVKVLQILGGSDVAEPFDVSAPTSSESPAPGHVVVIDPHHPGDLVVSTQPYDTAVAGIISGANGLAPGMILRSQGRTDGDGRHPVAMTGRVWCWVDASFGPVRPGDRLTTSPTPGHAMRADDPARADGAVIGKAMSSLDEGRGLVLVLVNLQ